jgi:hypothetical protein
VVRGPGNPSLMAATGALLYAALLTIGLFTLLVNLPHIVIHCEEVRLNDTASGFLFLGLVVYSTFCNSTVNAVYGILLVCAAKNRDYIRICGS